MKQLFFIFFLASNLLFTEGGYAQGVFEKNDIQPPSLPDSLVFDEVDTLENAITLPQERKESPYAAAQQEYFSQPMESKSIDKTRWEQAKSGINYSNDKIEKQKKQTNTGFNPMWGVLFAFLKWFFIIGAIVLLAYLIIRFVGEGNIFSVKKRRIADPSVQIDLEHIEENLEIAELDPLINQAISDKNYTLAIRLYYLAILKELHIKGDITWKKDKTNRIYVREMREHRFFEPFRTTTTVFERVWYGSQMINEKRFVLMQPDFQNLLKNLR
jgi:hypothetical protein